MNPQTVLDNVQAQKLANFFKMFADPTRLSILEILFEGERCVCDLSYKLGMNQSAVSHQLRTLRHSRLVSSRRAGKSIYYSLNDSHIEQILSCGVEHVNEGKQ
ncbi:MAG: ArsR/SmtB family transcription factor [Chitinispirillaceae bacterium]